MPLTASEMSRLSPRLLFFCDFLQRAGTLLSNSLDYHRTLPELGPLVVPMFADWCAIDLGTKGGPMERVLLYQEDARHEDAALALRAEFAPDGVNAHPVMRVMDTGHSELVREIDEQWMADRSRNERHLSILRDVVPRSAMLLPLMADGQMIGVLSMFVTQVDRPLFDESDLHVGELLASLVACAIRNARYTTELQAELHERRVLELRLQDVIKAQDSRVEELRTVMETVPAGVLIASDPECTRIIGNAEAHRQWRAEGNAKSLSPIGADGSRLSHCVIRRNGQIVAADDLPMQRAAKLGIATRDEEQELVFDDGSHRWLAVSATPLLDAEGKPRGAVGAALDITRTKQIEADLLERQEELEDEVHERTRAMIETHQRLREMERMATIGTLSAGLGHDMGNLLLPLRLRLDSLNSMTLPDPAPSDLAAIATVLEYLQRLASGLRSLAVDPHKPDRSSHVETKLRTWWADVHNLMRNAVPPGVTLGAKIPARLPVLRISSAALTQAVMNIVQNGGHALRNRPDARIDVRAELVPNKSEVRLIISDNGPGMDEQARKHCFEPFFSTKKRQISTGLGLAVVRAIITGAGGQVAVESSPGEGASFILTIPVSRRTPEESLQSIPSRRALVTVVDPRQRALVASVLKHDGYSVKHGEHDVEGSCDLWVTDAASPRSSTDLLSFVGAGSGRVALIMNVAATPVSHPRIRAVPTASDVNGLRAVLNSVRAGGDSNGDDAQVD